ncbi:hypothetical protein PF002_g17465 [Phytophthora fragariae]|uniref:Uncharacterized protein n=1 Tax=Phytophthora fragariae TaxID=53985 RepID=A0A6A3EJT3_9STRA|nr:hypothetical protein PF009_g17369 [Phytophthora fragariae]KAE9073442.1 hypothetical protein PF006_g28735 [Phytophthora fragariae]KAE9215124.1 hypothetical protein PF002_g17465 [Phytophthora fragariae]
MRIGSALPRHQHRVTLARNHRRVWGSEQQRLFSTSTEAAATERSEASNSALQLGGDVSVADFAIYALVRVFKAGRPGFLVTIADPYQHLQRVFDHVKVHH